MLEIYLRPLYQPLLATQLVKKMADYVEPQQLTCAACLTGIAVIPALLMHVPQLAIILLLISGYLDMLDGAVARIANKQTVNGAVLDILSDRIVELGVIAGLILMDPGMRAMYGLLMLGSCYICVTSFLVVGIFIRNQGQKSFHYSPGLMERAEAFIFFILMILAPQYFQVLAVLFSLLVLLTAGIRIREFLQQN